MTRQCLLYVSLLLAQTAAAEESFRFSRPILWQSGGQEELLAVPLDSRIYAATRDAFPDLRLVDQQGAETPYLLEKAAETRAETKRLTSDSELLALKTNDDKAIEIILHLKKDEADADGLTVFTPLTNFEHRLQIFGSGDGQNWSLLVKDAEIFDYSRYMPVSNRDIALPANHYRYFKVLIEEAVQTREAELLELTRKLDGNKEAERSERIDLQRIPLQIERIGFWRNQTEVVPDSEKRFSYPAAGFKITQDKEHKATLIDVEMQREPLTGFTLQTSSRNFSRSAAVQIAVKYGIETRMQEIGNAVLESLHFQDIQRDRSTVAFPEQRHSQYRIVIRDNDNPPLQVDAVTGLGSGYNLLFLPQKGSTYNLRYGSEKAERPRYETASIQELLRKGYKSTPALLGDETAVAEVPEAVDFAKVLNSKFFLGTVVALMVAVLAWSLVRVGKRLEQFPKE